MSKPPPVILAAIVSLVVVLAAAVTIVLITTGPATETTAGVATPTTTPLPPPARAATPPTVDNPMETFFLMTLDKGGIRYSRASVLALADRVCLRLDSGDTLLQAATFLYQQGYPSYDAGFIVGAASQTICQGGK